MRISQDSEQSRHCTLEVVSHISKCSCFPWTDVVLVQVCHNDSRLGCVSFKFVDQFHDCFSANIILDLVLWSQCHRFGFPWTLHHGCFFHGRWMISLRDEEDLDVQWYKFGLSAAFRGNFGDWHTWLFFLRRLGGCSATCNVSWNAMDDTGTKSQQTTEWARYARFPSGHWVRILTSTLHLKTFDCCWSYGWCVHEWMDVFENGAAFFLCCGCMAKFFGFWLSLWDLPFRVARSTNEHWREGGGPKPRDDSFDLCVWCQACLKGSQKRRTCGLSILFSVPGGFWNPHASYHSLGTDFSPTIVRELGGTSKSVLANASSTMLMGRGSPPLSRCTSQVECCKGRLRWTVFDKTAIPSSEQFSNYTRILYFDENFKYFWTGMRQVALNFFVLIEEHCREEHCMPLFLDIFTTRNQPRLDDRASVVRVPNMDECVRRSRLVTIRCLAVWDQHEYLPNGPELLESKENVQHYWNGFLTPPPSV